MRCLYCLLLLGFLVAMREPADAATGRVIKVLPEFLDKDGHTAVSPSLYERDAYQVTLREHPERRSGLRFYIQWKAKGVAWQPLRIRLELRGGARGNLPQQLVVESPIRQHKGLFGHWSEISLTHDDYTKLGGVTAWRVSLWEGNDLLSQQKSFLW